jgi:hypothetical protein
MQAEYNRRLEMENLKRQKQELVTQTKREIREINKKRKNHK